MMTELYSRSAGKYTMMKGMLGAWCITAKPNQTIVIATLHGNYKFVFKGKLKPAKSKFKFCGIDRAN